MATEKELDISLAAELERNPAFLGWFLSHTKFAKSGASFHSCRANHPWGTHPFRRTDAAGVESLQQRQSETDVLLLLKESNGRIVALHIENKIGVGKFTNDQAEMYAQRATHWMGKEHYGGYEDFDIVLVAPQAFVSRYGTQAAIFPVFVTHESIGQHIALFAELVGAA